MQTYRWKAIKLHFVNNKIYLTYNRCIEMLNIGTKTEIKIALLIIIKLKWSNAWYTVYTLYIVALLFNRLMV